MLEESQKTKGMDILELQKLLPHRYPFMLVDRVTEYEPGIGAKGYKNVSYCKITHSLAKIQIL